jgi:lysophospholipid acyltransferase (LPLAT)-like uncharacterized protein
MSPGKQKFVSHIGALFLRVLSLTLRVKFTDNAGFADGTLPCPALFAFWHNRILAMLFTKQRHYHNRSHVSVLTSASRDGGLLAEFMARFGMGSVRGSSSRRGAAAVREIHDMIREKLSLKNGSSGGWLFMFILRFYTFLIGGRVNLSFCHFPVLNSNGSRK